jgi:FkbM family methyltransferase
MIKSVKKFIFKYLKLENYLRILQWGYFFSYTIGLLRGSKNYAYHYFVKKMIHNGDVVIDIGANLGYYSILFAKWVGPLGKVFSVEPIAVYNKIFNERACKYSNIQLYPYALGLEEKSIELISSSSSGYLSTGLPHVYDSTKDVSIESQSFRFEAQMKVPSLLFKDLEKIDYIKCDVEGFELVILSDMKELIRRCRPKVQVEVWSENEEKILHLFEELRYLPYRLHRGKLILQKRKEKQINGDYIFLPEPFMDL